MPLGVLLLNDFADRIRLLELRCLECNTQKTLDTGVIAAKYTRFVSIPDLKRIGMPECPRGDTDCRAQFLQLERLFGGVPSRHRATTDGHSDFLSSTTNLHDKAPENRD
jgi:hypothetical protein